MRPEIKYGRDVPMAWWPKAAWSSVYGRMSPSREVVSAICRSMSDCEDLPHWFRERNDLLPELPILLLIPGLYPPVVVAGLGFSTPEELRDACRETWGVKTGLIEKFSTVFDWDDIRDREGQMRREDVAEAMAYAFIDRIAKHKASPRTDPYKQFKYSNPTERKVFTVDGMRPK